MKDTMTSEGKLVRPEEAHRTEGVDRRNGMDQDYVLS